MENRDPKFVRFAIGLRIAAIAVLSLASSLPVHSSDTTPEKKPADSHASSIETAESAKAPPAAEDYPKELFTGKVVMLHEALKRRNIKAYEEENKNQVVLETDKGELIPIVPDWRGRAFYQDKRLRDRKVELVGFRKPGVPYLQVLSIFTFNEKGERQYTDYWCDICSIPMYEIKKCDCCQGPIRLRFQNKDLPDYLTTKPVPSNAPANAAQDAKQK